jgi:precorrin-3B synthase
MTEPREPRGYCPGVWTPMPSGDGLIVRVRPRQARMPAAHLDALAQLARAAGNGIIELTRRGNLQIRGVSPSSWPGLREQLIALDLAGADPASDARPALFVCPLSGLDPRCPPLEPLADALEEVLSSAAREQRLPDKFSVVLGGGSQSSSELAADIHVRVHPDHPDSADLLVAGKASDALALGSCPIWSVAEAVRRLLLALEAFPHERRRMRDAVSADASRLLDAVRGLLGGEARREAAWGSPEVGYHTGSVDWFGYALPFGSAHADAWEALGRIAERFGGGEVRLTPTRHVLVVGVHPTDRLTLAELGQERAFGVRPPTRALELVACSGAPACRSAHGETRELARRLSTLIQGSGGQGNGRLQGTRRGQPTLHVSGCEKSCARDEAADVTLVHGADGLRLGFGRDVRATLTTPVLSLEGVRRQLSERFASAPGARRGSAEVEEFEQ